MKKQFVFLSGIAKLFLALPLLVLSLLNASQSDAASCSETPVAAGAYNTLGIKQDGTVVGVGLNDRGQLNVSSWTNIKAVAAGIYHTVGLKGDGTAALVGNDNNGVLNVSSWMNVKAIASGYYHVVGLKEDGTVVASGANNWGQLNVSSWANIKAVAAGGYHTVGLKEDGTVVAVGNNEFGQLDVSSWTNIKAIAADSHHTIGLKEDGTVVAVGYNSYGQLNVSSWLNIKAIAAGSSHTVGLKEDGTAVAIGYNGYGQSNVSSWTNIKAIDAGGSGSQSHTVGLKADGTVVAVGFNMYGQTNVSSWNNILPACTAPAIAVSPPSHNFGDVIIGGTSAHEFTLSNSGTQDLVVNATTITGIDAGQFTVEVGGVNPCPSLTPTIAFNNNCTVIAKFRPASYGAKTAALSISSNDPVTRNLDVPLSGSGICPSAGTYNPATGRCEAPPVCVPTCPSGYILVDSVCVYYP